MNQKLKTLWKRQLEFQVELNMSSEVKTLQKLRSYRTASNILELGTGDGSFITQLAKVSPEKTFHGIDKEKALLEMAKKRAQGLENISFSHLDLYAIDMEHFPQFDLIIARMVVQHLSDLEKFLKVTRNLLRKNGTLLIVEAEDSQITLVPEVQPVTELLQRIREAQPTGGPRAAIKKLSDAANKNGFILHKSTLAKTFVRGKAKQTAFAMWKNIRALAEVAFSVKVNAKAYNSALEAWKKARGSRAGFGSRYVEFRRF